MGYKFHIGCQLRGKSSKLSLLPGVQSSHETTFEFKSTWRVYEPDTNTALDRFLVLQAPGVYLDRAQEDPSSTAVSIPGLVKNIDTGEFGLFYEHAIEYEESKDFFYKLCLQNIVFYQADYLLKNSEVAQYRNLNFLHDENAKIFPFIIDHSAEGKEILAFIPNNHLLKQILYEFNQTQHHYFSDSYNIFKDLKLFFKLINAKISEQKSKPIKQNVLSDSTTPFAETTASETSKNKEIVSKTISNKPLSSEAEPTHPKPKLATIASVDKRVLAVFNNFQCHIVGGKICGFYVASNEADNELITYERILNDKQYSRIKSYLKVLGYNVSIVNNQYRVTTYIRLFPGWFNKRHNEITQTEASVEQQPQGDSQESSNNSLPAQKLSQVREGEIQLDSSCYRYDSNTHTTYYTEKKIVKHELVQTYSEKEIKCYDLDLSDPKDVKFQATPGVEFKMRPGRPHEAIFSEHIKDIGNDAKVSNPLLPLTPSNFNNENYYSSKKTADRHSFVSLDLIPFVGHKITELLFQNRSALKWEILKEYKICANVSLIQLPRLVTIKGSIHPFPGCAKIKIKNAVHYVLFNQFKCYNNVIFPDKTIAFKVLQDDIVHLNLQYFFSYKPPLDSNEKAGQMECYTSCHDILNPDSLYRLPVKFIEHDPLPLCFTNNDANDLKLLIAWLCDVFHRKWSPVQQTYQAKTNRRILTYNYLYSPTALLILQDPRKNNIDSEDYYELPGVRLRRLNNFILLELYYKKKRLNDFRVLFHVFCDEQGKLSYISKRGVQQLPLRINQGKNLASLSLSLDNEHKPSVYELRWLKGFIKAVNKGRLRAYDMLYEPVIAFSPVPPFDDEISANKKSVLRIFFPFIKKVQLTTNNSTASNSVREVMGLAYPAVKRNFHNNENEYEFILDKGYFSVAEKGVLKLADEISKNLQAVEKNPFKFDHAQCMLVELQSISSGENKSNLRYIYHNKNEQGNIIPFVLSTSVLSAIKLIKLQPTTESKSICSNISDKAIDNTTDSAIGKNVIEKSLARFFSFIKEKRFFSDERESQRSKLIPNANSHILRERVLQINQGILEQNEKNYPILKENSQELKSNFDSYITSTVVWAVCLLFKILLQCIKASIELFLFCTQKLIGNKNYNRWRSKLGQLFADAKENLTYLKLRYKFNQFKMRHYYLWNTIKGILVLLTLSILLSLAIVAIYIGAHNPNTHSATIYWLAEHAYINQALNCLITKLQLQSTASLLGVTTGIMAAATCIVSVFVVPLVLWLYKSIQADFRAAQAHDAVQSIKQISQEHYPPEQRVSWSKVEKYGVLRPPRTEISDIPPVEELNLELPFISLSNNGSINDL